MDCGATCLAMICKYYGKTYSVQTLREQCAISATDRATALFEKQTF
jgi:ATP-binding cassette subfamily B protein